MNLNINKNIKRWGQAFCACIPALLALVMLPGCSAKDGLDEDREIPIEESGEYYYITLNVETPTSPSSRSTRADDADSVDPSITEENGSSSSGELPGVDKENALMSAHIYFCDTEYKVLADFEAEYVDPVDNSNNSFLRVKVESLDALNGLVGQEKVYLLVTGNEKVGATTLYTPSDRSDLKGSKFTVNSFSGAIGDFGTDGDYMPLVNAEPFDLQGFDGLDSGKTAEQIIKSLFSRLTPTNAWWDVNNKSNPVNLERAVARFEYRGKLSERGASAVEEPEGDASSQYIESHVYSVDKMNVKMRLVSMTPYNVNTTSYVFRHTSPGTKEAWEGTLATVKMFGKENGNTTELDFYNWVVSPWWPSTPSLLNAFSNTDKKYLIDGDSPSKAAGTVTIDELMDRTVSEAITKKGTSTYQGGYHPWCYVMENTLYSQTAMDDEKLWNTATGVSFRFMVLDKNNEPVKFSTHEGVSSLDPNSSFPYEMAWSREEDKGNYLEITDMNTGDWVQIKPDEDGCYYLDYIAYIVHNYNEDGIGPMFFGVVRNNTYQISISKLAGLPNPNDPRKAYLELDINVLKWERRDVEFGF